MGTITPVLCRGFVNSVINFYDKADSGRDIFATGTFPNLEDFAEMVEPTAEMSKLITEMVKLTKVVEPTAKMVEPTAKMVKPTAKMVKPTAKMVELIAKMVELTPSLTESSIPKYNDQEKVAICAKGGIGRLLAVTKAFGPADQRKSWLIRDAVRARLQKLINKETIRKRDPLYAVQINGQWIMGDYGDAARLFSHIFETAFTQNRAAIVNQIKPFDAKLNTYSFWFARKVLNIQGMITVYTPNIPDGYKNILHTNIAVTVGVGLYIVGRALGDWIVQFFAATAVPQAQNLLHKYGSITIINLCEKICGHAVTLVAYVVNSRVYYWLYNSGMFYTYIAQAIAFQVEGVIPPVVYVVQTINFIRFSAYSIAMSAGKFVYDSYFSPAAQFQQKLVQSLATVTDFIEKEKLVEEGVKAYQVWVYLMTEGSDKGLFRSVADG